MVHIDASTLELSTITVLNTTGSVKLAYLGLPKAQFGEPANKHYAVVITPGGSNPANGDAIVFMDVRGTYHHWGYVQAGINLTSIAMDYDTHNCYVTYQQGDKSSFAIMHMLGGKRYLFLILEPPYL